MSNRENALVESCEHPSQPQAHPTVSFATLMLRDTDFSLGTGHPIA